jgi:hypothetical protein
MSNLKAGAASVTVVLNEDCFPNAECVGRHDDVYVKLLIFESNRRFAIFSADMPSIFHDEVEHIKYLLLEKAGVALADSWVIASHSLRSPHVWPLGENKQKDTPLPKIFDEKPEMKDTAQRINHAYRVAYSKAIDGTLSNMREASIGFDTSVCSINVNRNMYTIEG